MLNDEREQERRMEESDKPFRKLKETQQDQSDYLNSINFDPGFEPESLGHSSIAQPLEPPMQPSKSINSKFD